MMMNAFKRNAGLMLTFLSTPEITSRHLFSKLSTVRPSLNNAQLPHTPVMKEQVISLLNPQPGKTYIDMTFGAGGHTRGLLEACPGINIIALDRDPIARKFLPDIQRDYKDSNIRLLEGQFTELLDLLEDGEHTPANIADGVLFDVGVSSMQFDDKRRGFGLKSKGPLDMRMSKKTNITAADLLNKLEEKELHRILKNYGQEKKARQIARRVVEQRQALGPIQTTRDLQDLVSDVYSEGDSSTPADSLGRQRHPATLTFQALRIFVNDELNELYNGLKVAHQLLKTNAVCAVISFHSLEHNIVHQVFNATQAVRQETLVTPDITDNLRLFPWKCERKVIKPNMEEINTNPRARSAELRFACKKKVYY